MALSWIGQGTVVPTNGSAPGAVGVHASTQTGDLVLFFHYTRATAGTETVTLPTGFTSVFNSNTANQGLLAVGWRNRQAADSTYTATIASHTSGTSGNTVLEWTETVRGQDTTTPIGSFTASLSTWASSLNMGPIAAPSSASVAVDNWVYVVGGRLENLTGQTALTGDSLTWATRGTADSALGLDAGAASQSGLNATAGAVSVTAKTIATTGTAQAGAGRMFIVNVAAVTGGLSVQQMHLRTKAPIHRAHYW